MFIVMASNKPKQLLETSPYIAPTWIKGKVKAVPQNRITFAKLPTPIHTWTLPDLPVPFSVSIKRDDLTGCALSGNKIRNLEFILADVVIKGYKHVVTSGRLLSNHCRATAVAARRAGLQPHLLMEENIKDTDDVDCHANVLLNQLMGAKMYLYKNPTNVSYETGRKENMAKLIGIIEKDGEAVYEIPMGGMNNMGMFGYIQAFEEMIEQGVLEDYDDIVFACGSGGTAASLAIGNYLTGSRVKLHGIFVTDLGGFVQESINHVFDDIGLSQVREKNELDLIEGYEGVGYGLSTQAELDFIVQVATQTGIILDPVYSVKAAYGLQQELKKSPNRFRGKRILFLHTGGIFSLFDGRMDRILKTKESVTNQLYTLSDMKDVISQK